MRAVQPFSLGTIAMFVPGEHSSNDLSFSVKIQTKSELEILVLAMPILLLLFRAYRSPAARHRTCWGCLCGGADTPASRFNRPLVDRPVPKRSPREMMALSA